MPNEKTLRYVKSILERIDDIETACRENGGVVKALDTKISQSAIMLYLMRIHQQIEKLQKQGETAVLNLISPDIIEGIKRSRNIAAHDYDSLNFAIIEKTIRFDLPKIKAEFTQFLKKNKTQNLQTTLKKELKYYTEHKNSFYEDARLKQEQTILKIYNELKSKGEPIDDKSLKLIETIQKAHSKSR